MRGFGHAHFPFRDIPPTAGYTWRYDMGGTRSFHSRATGTHLHECKELLGTGHWKGVLGANIRASFGYLLERSERHDRINCTV